MASVIPFDQRPQGDILVLFDVDETLTPARRPISPEMLDVLAQLRKRVVTGFVGGSNLVKQVEQLGDVSILDYNFAENGLVAYKLGKELASQSFIKWIGEDKYKQMVKVILHYIADLDLPVKRGTFIEFRNGMINVSPIGRNASHQERQDFEAYDNIHHIRRDMIKMLKETFPDFGLTYSVGGQISFDVFPIGWNKTIALSHVENEGFKEIHFFGDKCYEGGNDYEIYMDERTIGHSVHGPEDTIKQLKELFLKD